MFNHSQQSLTGPWIVSVPLEEGRSFKYITWVFSVSVLLMGLFFDRDLFIRKFLKNISIHYQNTNVKLSGVDIETDSMSRVFLIGCQFLGGRMDHSHLIFTASQSCTFSEFSNLEKQDQVKTFPHIFFPLGTYESVKSVHSNFHVTQINLLGISLKYRF